MALSMGRTPSPNGRRTLASRSTCSPPKAASSLPNGMTCLRPDQKVLCWINSTEADDCCLLPLLDFSPSPRHPGGLRDGDGHEPDDRDDGERPNGSGE